MCNSLTKKDHNRKELKIILRIIRTLKKNNKFKATLGLGMVLKNLLQLLNNKKTCIVNQKLIK